MTVDDCCLKEDYQGEVGRRRGGRRHEAAECLSGVEGWLFALFALLALFALFALFLREFEEQFEEGGFKEALGAGGGSGTGALFDFTEALFLMYGFEGRGRVVVGLTVVGLTVVVLGGIVVVVSGLILGIILVICEGGSCEGGLCEGGLCIVLLLLCVVSILVSSSSSIPLR
eukprot:CAMPEP_0197546864 /NCGR_PEP_ID=MMETSP1320-20131121/1351_1 /TAXON_ID=91990 /ORGANISM="Bolidomonas sp., Strain RCC2347" /LENGTH=171 /DNA_ID=CAMNT_0043106505 /DNA_START=383 /DNA_END=899 /DNA_ORIENTATION=-